MGLFDALFGRKEEIIKNNKEVYEKFLRNYAENSTHEYLKKLTIEAGQAYYSSKRKDGQLTAEDEAQIEADMNKAVQDHLEIVQASKEFAPLYDPKKLN